MNGTALGTLVSELLYGVDYILSQAVRKEEKGKKEKRERWEEERKKKNPP